MTDSRNPEEIRDDIEETRSRVSRDLDEVGQRLSREGLKDETRSAIAGAEDVIVSATREAADRTMRRIDETGERFAERLAESPLPVALIGLGLGWMMMRAGETRHEPDGARSGLGGMGVRAAYRAGREEGLRRARLEREERAPRSYGAYDVYDRGEYLDEDTYIDEDGYVYVLDDEDDGSGGWIGTAVTVGAGLLVAGAAAVAMRAARGGRDDDHGYGAYRRGRVRDGFVVETGARSERALPRPGRTSGDRSGRSSRPSDWAWGRSVPYSYDDDAIHFQAHHRSLHGDEGKPFSEVEPDYRFGARLGTEDRLAGQHWDQVEDQIRQRWTARGRTDWTRRRDAIRYGFERARIAGDPRGRPERLP